MTTAARSNVDGEPLQLGTSDSTAPFREAILIRDQEVIDRRRTERKLSQVPGHREANQAWQHRQRDTLQQI